VWRNVPELFFESSFMDDNRGEMDSCPEQEHQRDLLGHIRAILADLLQRANRHPQAKKFRQAEKSHLPMVQQEISAVHRKRPTDTALFAHPGAAMHAFKQ
jgi:hypothetical protein